MGTKRTKKGFTLIELLVVIAVIALLLAIIIPTLGRAKEAGMRIVCLSNLKSLAMMVRLYANDHGGDIPSGSTESLNDRTNVSWVDHRRRGGGPVLNMLNVERDPEKEEEQRIAIRQGVLWPYASGAIKVYHCATTRLGYARSFSMPDSFAYDLPILARDVGIPDPVNNMLIRNIDKINNTAGRMLFIDEGFIGSVSWSIFYDQPFKWLDPAPARHGLGTTFAFIDGHADYWKWEDARTREFALEAEEYDNPDDASFLRPTHPGSKDIIKLLTAIWGGIGW
jgi:prepilin-type N-terminal cleavage/methylation domain-containing protein/prepilin-type processing-associated H-X9-DG protein